MLRCAREQLLVQADCIMHVFARDGSEQRGAEPPDVGECVDLVPAPLGLLGRHERGRADGHAGLRLFGLRVLHAREAEVEELHLVVPGHEDVVGLQVPMNDAFLVGRSERIEGVIDDLEHLVDRHRPAETRATRLHRLPLEQLEDEERRAIFADAVVLDVNHARMADRVRDIAFTEEARAGALVAREVRVQHLQRGAMTITMGRGIHGGHPARADASVDLPLAVHHRADTPLIRPPTRRT